MSENFFNSDTGQLIIIIGGGLLFLAIIIGLTVFLWKKALGNGASVNQVLVGKGIGEFCTSDAMCGSNKCRSGFCIM